MFYLTFIIYLLLNFFTLFFCKPFHRLLSTSSLKTLCLNVCLFVFFQGELRCPEGEGHCIWGLRWKVRETEKWSRLIVYCWTRKPAVSYRSPRGPSLSLSGCVSSRNYSLLQTGWVEAADNKLSVWEETLLSVSLSNTSKPFWTDSLIICLPFHRLSLSLKWTSDVSICFLALHQ